MTHDLPTESPLERIFAQAIAKYVPDGSVQSQVSVETLCGTFRLDFVVRGEGTLVAFECDGADFHEPLRDEWRDAMILGQGAVNTIYRLRGTDLFHRTADCLYLVSRFDPEIFTQRGLVNLERLATPQVRDKRIGEFEQLLGRVEVWYGKTPWEAQPRPWMTVERRSEDMPPDAIWRTWYAWAIRQGGGNLDAVMRSHPWVPKGAPQ